MIANPMVRCSFVAGHEYPEGTRGKRCLREEHNYGVHVIGPEGCTVREVGMVITIEIPEETPHVQQRAEDQPA